MNEDISAPRDPTDGAPLTRRDDALVAASGARYPIVKGIPRFVGADNYASDFGAQWNLFPKTQLDTHSGVSLSEERLERCLGFPLAQLRGKRVLEAGSGAGRFTEVLLKHGALLHSFDYSNAVEANAANNGANDNLLLLQADIRNIPLPAENYDVVVCLGVIQHTPDPEQSIACLWKMVKPGGVLVIDHYRRSFWRTMPVPLGDSERVYRWLMLRLPPHKRFAAVKKLVDFWFPFHWKLRRSRNAQRFLARLSPLKFYYPAIPLRSREDFYEWAVLDTHDATTDYYKHLRSRDEIQAQLIKLGGQNIHAEEAGNGVEARATKAL